MIYYPKTFGTCAGSNNAINMAFKLKDEYKNKKVYIYKEILHNPYIINLLKRNNIICIDDLNIVTKNDILIIRAHGEPKSTYEYLDKKKITYYDATCINVKRVHELVEQKYLNHENIIIVGKKNHPEVIGTNGWCNNSAIIVEDKNDYKSINKKTKYFIVCQTTVSKNLVDDLLKYLNKQNIKYDFVNTICVAQKNIQSSSLETAKNIDVMFVIGGKSSSNTKELFNLLSKQVKTYYFSDLLEFYNFIKKKNYTTKTKIAFTGGASTPKEQIYEYANLLEFIIYYKNELRILKRRLNYYNNKIFDDNTIINNALNKFIKMNNDGKFIRGCLIDLGYKLNKNDNYSKDLSIAYETFETSILIHDDIIDNADVRRSKKTIHKEYEEEYKNFNISNDSTNTSLALCLGDYGMYYANQIIINAYKNDKNISKLLYYYNDIVMKTIKGEILDVYLPFIERNDKNHTLKESDILEIYKLKTSYYTIVGPFILGMILANQTNKSINIFKNILIDLGIAFQIKDDILGIFGSDKKLGKSTSSDIEEFKQTILYSYIKTNKKEYLSELLKYYGEKDTTKEVQKIFIESGALEYANEKMNTLFNKTKEQINNLNIKKDIKNILLGFITFLEIREK